MFEYRQHEQARGGGGLKKPRKLCGGERTGKVNCSNPTTVNQSDYFACECKGTDGNPPADVTWYKDNLKIVTGKERAILRFPDVDEDDSGTYRCETTKQCQNKRLEQDLVNAREKCKHLEDDIQVLMSGRNNEIADVNQTVVSLENKLKISEALNASLRKP